MSDSEDPIDIADDVGDDDLFGDGDDVISDTGDAVGDQTAASDKEDDEPDTRRRRDIDDDEDEDEPREFREKLVAEVPLYRHRTPRSRDGGLHSLRVPDFIKFNPMEYKSDNWQPSRWDLENANTGNPIPAIRYRRDPKTGRMQSNANIHRWSDGSVTLSVGDEHYEIQSKALAPPQNKPYREVQDAHYYAAAAHLTTNSLLIVGHLTEQYTVRPNKELQDHALERLVADLAGAKKDRGADMIIATTVDPELQKRQAELAEKERAKLQRRRDTAAARADGTGSRYKGGGGGGGALSVGDLEGRRGAGAGGRKRGAPGGAKQKRRRPEYDSDDDLPSGARRVDNYDMDDGFLVNSEDEESEGVEGDDDEEELLDDDDEEDEAPPRAKRQRTTEPADEDAEGEDDGPTHVAEASRHRRRRVIEDDDEE
ncbi:Leo1-like protein-domain-containing protein [Dichotomopilus funicola]|uniref:Leo1-like protein-domain-containing protein n=1 Tax=Dichotomopilus funicola TaxID=1934379 RepID=A0AAN6ZRM6_9PEZI|nr:Leo1-like protein-domain-containing protein [Dichotomopilus funicola]